jgi:hypothetical protein
MGMLACILYADIESISLDAPEEIDLFSFAILLSITFKV